MRLRMLTPGMRLWLVGGLCFLLGAGLVWFGGGGAVRPAATVSEPARPAQESDASKPVPVVAVTGASRLQPEEAEIPEITDALRSSYAGAADLVGTELTAETVRGLFAQPESQVRLLAAPEPAVEETKPQIKLLARRIVYWRPGALTSANLDAFAAAWPGLAEQQPLGLVLDLRQVSVSADYEGAADLLSFFASPETTLFTIQELKTAQRIFRARRQPLELPSGFPVVVLIHARTKGPAEVVAEWLATRRGAILLGEPTDGQGWPSREVVLKSGRVFRLPVARVVSPTGHDLAKGPVQPDVLVVADRLEEASALAFASAGRIEEAVAEVPSRRQQNEASLLREENPELDELIENQSKTKPSGPPPPRDVALQRALDVIEAVAAMHLAPQASSTKR